MSELKGVKIGGYIASSARFGSANELFRIDRLTATTVVCGDTKFRIADGMMLGSSSEWNTRYGRIATADDMVKERIRRAREKLRNLIVTAENVEAVEALFAATPPQGGR